MKIKSMILGTVMSLAIVTGVTQVDAATIHDKAVWGWEDLVQEELDNGVNVDARDERGWTALMHAVNYGNTEVVELLLAANADVNATNNVGYTALMYARGGNRGRDYIVQLIKDHIFNTTIGNKAKSARKVAS